MIDFQGRGLIFILSTPRSGSTLLGAMLGSHTQMFCPPEPWLLLPLRGIFWNSDAATISQYDDQYAREAWRLLIDDAVFNQASAAFARAAYNLLLERHGKQVFVDKTPRYYNLLPWLDSLFPAALKIWLKRNPLDVVASCKSAWGLSIEELTGDIISPHTFDTTIAFDLLASYFDTQAAAKIVLPYEDLVRNPKNCLENICRVAGLSFEESMVNHRTDMTMARLYAEARMGDKQVFEHDAPHPNSIGRWRNTLTPREIQKILTTLGRDTFIRYGYNEAYDEAAAQAGLNGAGISAQGQIDMIYQHYFSYVDTGLLRSNSVQRTQIARENLQLKTRVAELEAQARITEEKRPLSMPLDEAGTQGRLVRENLRLQMRVADLEAQGQVAEEKLQPGVPGAQEQLRRENLQLRWQVANLEAQLQVQADRLRILRQAFQTIQSGRVYRTVRRLGGWRWVERMMNSVGSDEAGS